MLQRIQEHTKIRGRDKEDEKSEEEGERKDENEQGEMK
jgi:hypothetical protein